MKNVSRDPNNKYYDISEKKNNTEMHKNHRTMKTDRFFDHFTIIETKWTGIAPFDHTVFTESVVIEWEKWFRSFEWCMRANRIDDEEDKFVKLMHLGGPKIQELYETLPVPSIITQRLGPLVDEEGGETFDEIVPNEYETALAKLNGFFASKKNVTYERHQLRLMKQDRNEKIGTFVLKLRAQAERCNFGEKIDEHIEDQMIEKCFSPSLRLDMLRCGDVDLETMLATAIRFEAVEEQQKIFEAANEQPSKQIEVNKIENKPSREQHVKQKPQSGDRSLECSRCGYTGHKPFDEKCPAKGKSCNKCGGKDHFARKCRSQKRKNDGTSGQSKNQQERKNTNKNDSETETKRAKSEDKDDSVKYIDNNEYVFCIGDSQNEIECKIGGIELKVCENEGRFDKTIEIL